MAMKTTLIALSILLTALSASAHNSQHGHHHSHSHSSRHVLPKKRNAQETQLRKMFKRQSASDYPAPDVNGPAPLAAWTAQYNLMKAQGLIPDILPSVNNDGWPAYPASVDTASDEVCSWTMAKCEPPEDIFAAPAGTIGISFDDGPQLPSGELYDFLIAEKIPSTHFVIGSRIIQNADLFTRAIEMDGHIAVHTWSHPLLSSMTDAQVLGELGWTMQAIFDYSDGIIPAYWRPPYGDVDNRVRAIARHVFGLTCVIWNQDTDDWCLADDGTNSCGPNRGPQNDRGLAAELNGWITGPKNPGLVILEHEHRPRAVAAFVRAYPTMISQGWNITNIPDMYDLPWYQNGDNSNDGPWNTAITIGSGNHTNSAISSSASSSSSSATASASSASGSVRSSSASSQASNSAGTLQADNATTGFSALAPATRWGIIGGAAGVGAMLLGLLIYCLCAKRKPKKAPLALSSSRNRAEVSSPVNEFNDKHPYENMRDTDSSWSLAEKSPNMTAPPSPTPLVAGGRPNLATRASNYSNYSQEGADEADQFARLNPQQPASAHLSPVNQQRSTFHLPNRAGASPYNGEDRSPTPEWI